MKRRMKKFTALFMAMMLVCTGCAGTEEPVIQEEEDITIEEVVEEQEEEQENAHADGAKASQHGIDISSAGGTGHKDPSFSVYT